MYDRSKMDKTSEEQGKSNNNNDNNFKNLIRWPMTFKCLYLIYFFFV